MMEGDTLHESLAQHAVYIYTQVIVCVCVDRETVTDREK